MTQQILSPVYCLCIDQLDRFSIENLKRFRKKFFFLFFFQNLKNKSKINSNKKKVFKNIFPSIKKIVSLAVFCTPFSVEEFLQ